MSYEEFIESKRHRGSDDGIDLKWLPEKIFPHQEAVTRLAAKKGRCAVFLDTGLGKTIIELSIAKNYTTAKNSKALIMCPLAVASQILNEAEKFGIDGVEYSRDGKHTAPIVVCNYERLHHFDPSDFDTVILDESSILKNFDGATKNAVTSFFKKVKYRFLCTATPSPNDYIELGTSSEALGFMGYTDMLGRFFKSTSNTNVKGTRSSEIAGNKFYLKPHAEMHFWQWVSSWSIAMRKPSDMGFDDGGYILPELIESETVVKNENPLAIDKQIQLFNMPAKSFKEIRAEVNSTTDRRCEEACNKAKGRDSSVLWVNTNAEADAIKSMLPEAHEVRGSMSLDQKEDILVAFAKGEITHLITKASITGFGLNWQHCAHTVYFPTFSYEQYYQVIRRFWRFGQKRKVLVDMIRSDGQARIMESLMAKKEKASRMFDELLINVNGEYKEKRKDKRKDKRKEDLVMPAFLRVAK